MIVVKKVVFSAKLKFVENTFFCDAPCTYFSCVCWVYCCTDECTWWISQTFIITVYTVSAVYRCWTSWCTESLWSCFWQQS